MEVNLIAEGLKFMVLGMSTVFAFLLMMIYVLKLQEKIVSKLFSKKDSVVATAKSKSELKTVSTDSDAQLVAVITAAIKEFKK